jgi:ribosome-associated protein
MPSSAGRQPLDLEALRSYFEFAFTTSPGPGGQNVNKVSTRVTLLFNFENCPAVSPHLKERIRARLRTRISRDGRLRTTSHKERSQSRNRSAAEQKLLELLEYAGHTPKPRHATKPTLGSKRRRLAEKRQHSERKRERQAKAHD